MTEVVGPRRELERTRDGDGPGADQARIALSGGASADRVRAAILALATGRGASSSTCPSDAARAVADDWRPLLPLARQLTRDLARTGAVRVTQRGTALDPGADWRGPIRIHLPAAADG
ncbi:DUF3253 domain-containing protein [Actinokineospora terrae]|nr:DUF3253 domain-containing protein [Actinokineospora terrae]